MANGSNKSILSAVGSEMKENPPAVLNATKRKFGAQRSEKQRVAILLSKARKAGASIPQYGAKKMSGGY